MNPSGPAHPGVPFPPPLLFALGLLGGLLLHRAVPVPLVPGGPAPVGPLATTLIPSSQSTLRIVLFSATTWWVPSSVWIRIPLPHAPSIVLPRSVVMASALALTLIPTVPD
ncbi:MAG: hypothetical protein R3247_12560, partial [Rhodothermales bacterium]|nr:hypothetical protein [Rhodothermales bacterium]